MKYKDVTRVTFGIPIELGRVVATPGALMALTTNKTSPLRYLERHRKGDWGVVGPEDWKSNNDAVIASLRILSVYALGDESKIWIITEWDRSVTTILLPEEY